MPKPFATKLDARCKVLLRDFGYKVEGNTLISLGIRGFSSDRIVGRVRNLFDAVERLIPTIKEDEFQNRYHDICA